MTSSSPCLPCVALDEARITGLRDRLSSIVTANTPGPVYYLKGYDCYEDLLSGALRARVTTYIKEGGHLKVVTILLLLNFVFIYSK